MQNLILAAVQENKGDKILVTTITGILIVFMALILLIFVIWLFGKFFSGVSGKKKASEGRKTEENKAAPVKTAPVAAPIVLPTADVKSNDDIIAVIAAAVAVYGESEGKNYAVRSVRRAANAGGRSAWAAAGIAENVRSF